MAWALCLACWLGVPPSGPNTDTVATVEAGAASITLEPGPRRLAVPLAPPVPAPVPPDRLLGEDKLRHFAMSFAMTGMAYAAGRLGLEPDPALAAAVGITLAAGIGKEAHDLRRGSSFSVLDLGWDVAGVALGAVLAHQIR